MTLAREGWAISALALALAAATAYFIGWLSLPLWLLLLLVLQFFRDPLRVPAAPAAGDVLSAADGRVVYAGAGQSPLDGSDKIKISVFMNVFNVHVNRLPVSGSIVRSQRFSGGFFNAALDKASEQNERHLIVIDSSGGEVIAVQIAGLLARRVLCYAQPGEMWTAGARYGFIRFGSRVDLYLPPDADVQVRLGDKVAAALSVVARLKNHAA